jgi:hypothetical protein
MKTLVIISSILPIAAFVTPNADFLLDIDGNSVSTGRTSVCVIEQTPGNQMGGRIKCWHGDDHAYTPPADMSYIQVVTGMDFSCGLTTERTAHCWGASITGQLEGSYTQLTCDSKATFLCGLLTDGSIKCLGMYTYLMRRLSCLLSLLHL